jgi:hypothetical protein
MTFYKKLFLYKNLDLGIINVLQLFISKFLLCG